MKPNKNIIIIADTFVPDNTSGAVQLYDLSKEFINFGVGVTVLTLNSSGMGGLDRLSFNGIDLIRVGCLKSRNVNLIRRAISEILTPVLLIFTIFRIKRTLTHVNGIVWYSPSIFFGPVIWYLKKILNCRSYLILRDIFPDWAVQLGLMKKNFFYFVLKVFEWHQYSVANTIGIQSFGDMKYFELKLPLLNARWSHLKNISLLNVIFNYYLKIKQRRKNKIEVLYNWLGQMKREPCHINIKDSLLSDRKIFVYAGNMGPAQGLDLLLEAILLLNSNSQIGFVFVGRGLYLEKIRGFIVKNKLANTLIFDEIPSSQVYSLYCQCDVGIVSLNSRHLGSNIPGKFYSYLQAGLPIFAILNHGNELEEVINKEKLGIATTSEDVSEIVKLIKLISSELICNKNYKSKCLQYSKLNHHPRFAVRKIYHSLFF